VWRRLIGERLGSEEPKHFGDAFRAVMPVKMANAEGDILTRGQMREQSWLLGDIADGSSTRRNRGAARGVEQDFPAELDAAGSWLLETRDDAEQCGLAGTRRAEDDGPLIVEREFRVQREAAELMSGMGRSISGAPHVKQHECESGDANQQQ
jgi:hypothetical protein